ncbi:MAG: hypothetical protein K6F50_00970 [Kiritimatiellae bacterium]|nr:hypothetical protein [Kiritimatiellia bacterium]
MTLCAAILAGALTRAEIIDRFKAPAMVKVSGLVQVVGDCPADMRREFQGPIAVFAAGVCKKLYLADRRQPAVFKEPGISIYVGDGRTNDTSVVVKTERRESGEPVTRIRLPSPATSDLDRLRIEIVKAYALAVNGETLDDARAGAVLRAADPDLKDDWEYAQIDRWLKGEKVDRDDEGMLRLFRAVITPGVARESDVLRFASRLRLYPHSFDMPFAGRFHDCTFKDAMALAKTDPRIRFAALAKSREIVLAGCGRGEELAAAAEAYSKFLFELSRGVVEGKELSALLEDADMKFEIALESARKGDEERNAQ